MRGTINNIVQQKTKLIYLSIFSLPNWHRFICKKTQQNDKTFAHCHQHCLNYKILMVIYPHIHLPYRATLLCGCLTFVPELQIEHAEKPILVWGTWSIRFKLGSLFSKQQAWWEVLGAWEGSFPLSLCLVHYSYVCVCPCVYSMCVCLLQCPCWRACSKALVSMM